MRAVRDAVIADHGLMPYFFGGWGENASVRLSPAEVLTGQTDVLQYLQAIPAHRVRAMQAVISKHAHRVMWAIGGYHGDVVERLLAVLSRQVRND